MREATYRRLTLAEYHSLPELPFPVDLVDGYLVLPSKPTPLHNRIARRLAGAIENVAPPEWQVETDVDVLLSDDPDMPTEVAPDVVVFSLRHDPATQPIPAATVLWIAEVVSPGDKRKDGVDYPPRYAAAGVRYFWRIETPATAGELRVETFALQDGRYVPAGSFTDELEVDEPFPVAFAVSSLADVRRRP